MTEVVTAVSQAAGADVREAHPGFEVYDSEFAAALGPAPRLALVAETDAHEGPVYIPGEEVLYFTSLPGKVDIPVPGTPGAYVKRLALDGLNFPVNPSRLSVVPAPVHMPNEMALGHDGRLVVCEQGTRAERARISRVDPTTGEVETVVDAWGGLRLNSPNDVVVRSDGTIWFTDPSYGYLQGFRPEPQVGDYVYRYDPGSGGVGRRGRFRQAQRAGVLPRRATLYVTDSGANQEPGSYHVRRPAPHHGLRRPGRQPPRAGRLFAVTTPGFPDGIKVDLAGRVYASSFSGRPGIQPGRRSHRPDCACPGPSTSPSAGPGGEVLFITTDTAIWAAVLNPAAGVRPRR